MLPIHNMSQLLLIASVIRKLFECYETKMDERMPSSVAEYTVSNSGNLRYIHIAIFQEKRQLLVEFSFMPMSMSITNRSLELRCYIENDDVNEERITTCLTECKNMLMNS